jgi:phosphoribosylanthranilate isomerase
LSRRIRKRVGVPVFLAGGLSAANLRRAIDAVAPFGLDLCSSVRSEDRLDPARLDAFFAALQGPPAAARA